MSSPAVAHSSLCWWVVKREHCERGNTRQGSVTSSGVLEARRWEWSGPPRQTERDGGPAAGCAGLGPLHKASSWKGRAERSWRTPHCGSENPAAPPVQAAIPRSRQRVSIPWEVPAHGEKARLYVLPPEEAATEPRNNSPHSSSAFCTPTPSSLALLRQQHQPRQLTPGAGWPQGGRVADPGRACTLGVQLCGRRQWTWSSVFILHPRALSQALGKDRQTSPAALTQLVRPPGPPEAPRLASGTQGLPWTPVAPSQPSSRLPDSCQEWEELLPLWQLPWKS